MDGSFLTVLWNDKNKKQNGGPDTTAFDIQGHETLKDAVLYLVKNGAKYENQEIVTRVNWMPDDNRLPIHPIMPVTPVTPEIPAPPAGVGPIATPEVLDFSNKPRSSGDPRPGTKSIFDGVLPPHVMGMIRADD
jgi:hypothetical protein